MSISTLSLSYCTNVHPGRTVAEVLGGLTDCTARVRQSLGAQLAAGLWFAQPVVRELQQGDAKRIRLRETLAAHGLCCYTLNAFPYGDFHTERVKEQVYVPDWTSPERLEYTAACAVLLAKLLPDGTEGSISTVPLGCKQLATQRDFADRCIANLLRLVKRLDDLHDETGRVIRLAIEPEPLCTLETTAETIAFFKQLYARAADAGLLSQTMRHVGVCYDVCHQSVEFENVADSIAALQSAAVRINKVHITCAIRLEDPARNAEGRAALAQYVEPRYLHQTFARTSDGRIVHQFDLDAELCASPPAGFRDADEWRVHFHVPVNAEELGPLKTTRDDLKRALAAVAKLEYAPHLEVETYTWGVLPGRAKPDLVDGLTAELTATRALLAEISPATSSR
jgi:sugar phosphate isomerase/epimerase